MMYLAKPKNSGVQPGLPVFCQAFLCYNASRAPPVRVKSRIRGVVSPAANASFGGTSSGPWTVVCCSVFYQAAEPRTSDAGKYVFGCA